MTRTLFFGAALAALSIGTVAQAAEHRILVLPDAYFPRISYVNSGDTVRFVNTGESTHEIISKNGDWTLEIAAQSEAVMVVEQGLQTEFYDASSQGEDGTYAVDGRISFAAAPID